MDLINTQLWGLGRTSDLESGYPIWGWFSSFGSHSVTMEQLDPRPKRLLDLGSKRE